MPRSFEATLREGSKFFMKSGDVHEAMRRISKRLKEEGIPHAIIGGMAVDAHGFARFTSDVDLLTTKEGLERIHQTLVGRGYVPMFPGARKSLRDVNSGVKVEFITTGEYPGNGKPKPIVFPDPREVAVEIEGHSVIRIEKLIELKLASGIDSPERIRDLADVQDLIMALKLPRSLGDTLDASVRDEYYRRWEFAQNARNPSDS